MTIDLKHVERHHEAEDEVVEGDSMGTAVYYVRGANRLLLGWVWWPTPFPQDGSGRHWAYTDMTTYPKGGKVYKTYNGAKRYLFRSSIRKIELWLDMLTKMPPAGAELELSGREGVWVVVGYDGTRMTLRRTDELPEGYDHVDHVIRALPSNIEGIYDIPS